MTDATTTTEDRPGFGFWIGLALGTPVMVYGAYELVQQMGWSRAFDVAKWLGGGLVLHDLVLVPIVLTLVWATGRIAPGIVRVPLRVGVLGSALIVAVAWPALRGYGDRPDNPTVHPLDYGSSVLTALALLWGAVATWSVVVVLRSRRPRPTA
jgi:multisubunit Na+/H+ antiporter MnhE subunit